MADNILEQIRERLRKRLNDYADDLAGGSCMSEDTADKIAVAYAHKAGVIQGLAMTERDILDILEEKHERENNGE